MSDTGTRDRNLADKRSSGLLYFWRECALYIGPGLPATPHSHHAIQICVSLSGAVRLRPGPSAPWQEYRGALVPADQPHESDVAVDLLATLWLEPGLADARAVVPDTTRGRIVRVEGPELAELREALLACWRQRWAPRRAASLLDETLRAVSSPVRPGNSRVDARVARVLGIVRSRSGGRCPLKELAALVALSPRRLEHLFKATTGVSLRHYLLWQRLRRAVEELATGSSVTRAAHSAGFSDTAHLSRTFRRMLGFTPSSALQRQGSSFVQAHDETHS
jgi:AraC family transcriptional regulator